MCLDWLDRHAEAGPFYRRAEWLDPNGYFTAANIGWHYIQVGDYPAAREWFERSLRLEWNNNVISRSYLDWVEQKLVENASGKSLLPPGY
jgi:tetratricopeptide (TPR) repeat protein